MKKRILFLCLISMILSLIFCACTKEVDFNQINDFEVSPVVESSLIFLNEPANKFYNNGVELTTFQDSVSIKIFKDKFIKDHLVKAELVFETANSIDRGFNLRVDFLTDTNTLQHTFNFSVPASPTNSVLIYNYTEVFEGNELLSLLATEKLLFTLNLQPGEAINESTLGSIQLKSKGIFYLNIDNTL
ncbi:hypothetical protein [Seonamhaeicola maritimus]|uniref:hypothetical protein n=1 Tax=Seonamhaeicola maritimus TaxID=2591822 RepID=UPI0024947411|nr:hypothetical protein [Seonamhaeicola maritimus]